MASRQTTPDLEFSILIGLVSTEDRQRIFQVLDAINNQSFEGRSEVIIVDRLQDHIGEEIDKRYPGVRKFDCPPGTPLSEMRMMALKQAGGRFVIVTEDHCIPAPDWLESFSQVICDAPEKTVAVGGCVSNGVVGTAFDRATYLCEYGDFAEPVADGPTKVLPGMNIAYHRATLNTFEDDCLSSGFWESVIHPQLLEQGFLFYSSNRIRITHSKQFSFGLFVRQRFLYSRYYAGCRFPPGQITARFVSAMASIVLPVLLLYRRIQNSSNKTGPDAEVSSAVPVLILFYMVWALGEMIGYLFGHGDALKHIE